MSPRHEHVTSPLPSRLASRRATPHCAALRCARLCCGAVALPIATLPRMATRAELIEAGRVRMRENFARWKSPDAHTLGWGIDFPPTDGDESPVSPSTPKS